MTIQSQQQLQYYQQQRSELPLFETNNNHILDDYSGRSNSSSSGSLFGKDSAAGDGGGNNSRMGSTMSIGSSATNVNVNVATTTTTATKCPNTTHSNHNNSGSTTNHNNNRSNSNNKRNPPKDHNHIFVLLIILFGIVASGIILRIGIHGAQLDVMERFQHEANEVSNAIAVSSWHDYETIAMWIHESCHMVPDDNYLIDNDLGDNDDERSNVTTTTASSTFLLEDGEIVPDTVDVATLIGFCSRAKFRHLYEHVLSLDVPFVAMQYLPNITHNARHALEYQSLKYHTKHNPAVAEKYVGIKEINLNEHGVVDKIGYSPPKPFYFPIHYMHPLEKNEAAVEIDIYSFEKDDVDKALTTGLPILSRRARLFQDPRPEIYGVTIIHPGRITSVDEERRRDAPRAVAKLVVRVADILTRAAATLKAGGLSVYIYDVTKDANDDDGDNNIISTPVFLAGADIDSKENIILKNETLCDDVIKHHQLRSSMPSSAQSSPSTYMDKDKLFFTAKYNLLDREWMIVVRPIHYNDFNPDLTYVILGAIFMFVACTFLASWLKYHHQREVTMNYIKTQAAKERAYSALKQVQRERHLNDFIAHEVRNPLSSAIAALSFITEDLTTRTTETHDLLQNHCHENEETESTLFDDLHVLDNSLNYINDLLRNMLDIHRTDSNSFKPKCSPTPLLKDLLEPARNILCVRRRPRGGGGEGDRRGDHIRFEAECDPPNLVANIDRLRVEQILLNLALNSTKFVEKGFIRLRAEVVDIPNDSSSGCRARSNDMGDVKQTVRLVVEDSGPGISLDKRDRLFEKYQESLDLMNQGTGIGLYICKNLSQLMGATIWLDETYDSQVPNQPGARFVIDLNIPPLPPSYCDETGGIFVSSNHPPKISNQDFLPCFVGNTPSAVQDLQFDPESLLACSDTSDKAAASASADIEELSPPQEEKQESEDIASTDVPASALHRAGLGDPRVGEPPLAITRPPLMNGPCLMKSASIESSSVELPSRLRVLFVDDDATLRKLFARSIRRLAPEWELQEAPNGETALELVKMNNSDKEPYYDLIFVDMYMASTSQKKQLLGTETVTLLRKECINSNDKSCIICGLSANDLEEQFLDAGANTFVLKPFPCKKDEMRREMLRVLACG